MNTLSSLLKNLRNRTPVGSIEMYAGSTPPTDWLLCDGTAVSRETYASLFNVIGTAYGSGDGSTTFNLPDFRDRAPVGAGSTYSLNASGGTATETFTDAQLAHGHGFTNPSVTGGGGTIYGGSHTHAGFWGRNIYLHTGDSGGMVWFNTGSQRYAVASSEHTHALPAHSHDVWGGSVANLHGASSSRTSHDNRMPYRGINFIIYAG